MKSTLFTNAQPAAMRSDMRPEISSGATVRTGIQVVVTGRNMVMSARHRMYVADQISRLQKYTTRVIRYDVEFYHENNPRQLKLCQRVTITGRGNGARVRAESCGPTFHAALDTAIHTLQQRLCHDHAKRRTHHGHRRRTSVAAATAPFATALFHDRHPGAPHTQPAMNRARARAQDIADPGLPSPELVQAGALASRPE